MDGKKKNILIGVLLIGIISMTVAYATLSQQLNINGSGRVQARSDTWNIHFDHIESGDEVVVPSGAYTTTASNSITLSSSDTVATLPEVTFKAPGDSVTFLFDVINEGDVTGYINSVSNFNVGTLTFGQGETLTTEQKNSIRNALSISIMYNDGNNTSLSINDSIAKNERKHLKVVYTFSNSVTELPSTEVTFGSITGQIIYKQDPTGNGSLTPVNPSAIVPALPLEPLAVGDTVNFGSQGFHVLWSNYNETALLADYNLDTGNVTAYRNSKYKLLANTNRQVAVTINNISQSNSTDDNYVIFSPGAHGYWDLEGNGLSSSFAYDLNGIPASYNGDPYPYVYTSRSNAKSIISAATATATLLSDTDFVAYYVEGYVESLKNNYNAPSTITGRLASYEELFSIYEDNDYTIPEWMQGNYCLGSAYHSSDVWKVNDNGFDHSYIYYGNTGDSGVRPVIVVTTSDLQ